MVGLFDRNRPLGPVPVAVISDNNLFDPKRGVEEVKAAPARAFQKKNFELTGICTMGSISGAVILDTSKRSKRAKFVKVGKEIGESKYKLIAIDPQEETVTVGVGNTQFTLKLERSDKGSIARRKQVKDAAPVITLAGTKRAGNVVPKPRARPAGSKAKPNVKPKPKPKPVIPRRLPTTRAGVRERIEQMRRKQQGK